MKALIIRIVKQMLGDKRSLGLILFAPIIIISLMYLLFSESTFVPTVATKDLPPIIINNIDKEHMKTVDLTGNADELLKNKEVDGIVLMEKGQLNIKFLEPNATKIGKVTKALKDAISKSNPSSSMNISYIYGKPTTNTFDSLGYIFMSIFSFFFVFLIAGISFVRERTTGTMERFLQTPIKRYEVVLGYTIGLGIFAALQSVILILYTKYVLGLEMAGPMTASIIVMILLAFTAVSLGAFISLFAENEFQVVQFIPIIIVPQIFFTGLIPVDTLPYNLDKLSYIMPVFYGSRALNHIFIRGYNIFDIWLDALFLLAIIFVLFIVNTLILKRYRKL